MTTRERFLSANPGLSATLALPHPILQDMNRKLTRFGSLSPAQIAFAARLAGEVQNPERHVPAPEGTVVVRGTVISVKEKVDRFGTSWKMTVKVATQDGSYLVWATVPRAIGGVDKGAEVEFTADLTRSDRDAHFAFGKRPRAARELARPAVVVAPVATAPVVAPATAEVAEFLAPARRALVPGSLAAMAAELEAA
jgi:hypothetical protein